MRFDRVTITYLIVLLCIVIVASIITTLISTDTQTGKRDREASDSDSILSNEGAIPYLNLAGDPIDIRPYGEGPLIVSTWASWCPACADELETLSHLARAFDDKDITIIAINRKENAGTARSFLETVNVSEDVLVLLDPDDYFFQTVGGYAMPETIFYDEEGTIVSHQRKDLSFDEMQKLTNDILKTDK